MPLSDGPLLLAALALAVLGVIMIASVDAELGEASYDSAVRQACYLGAKAGLVVAVLMGSLLWSPIQFQRWLWFWGDPRVPYLAWGPPPIPLDWGNWMGVGLGKKPGNRPSWSWHVPAWS